MPLSPTQRMKLSAKKIDSAIAAPRVSDDEKKRREKEKEEAKSAVPQWVVGMLLFVIVGSSLVQIFFSIQNSPSMSATH
eukprot:CAMPEP_0176440884 /NCGR_PEP_ID=MMETSP0127-20121128/20851_1 /TAXON_ID=938130 /ORGANISM="Platyophrya macrostoma, Strain WH" /LENGTH=78 /DNA_ID=CAMNT_0017825523 /DNA_START=56 /DNA_END=292 /DNA_ORIENTATION=-